MATGFTHFYSRHKIAVSIAVGFLALLIVIWIATPLIAKYYLNHRILPNLSDYTGRVEDVDVNFFTGSYALNDLVLWPKKEEIKVGDEKVPFFRVGHFSVGVSWEGLVNGALLASARVEDGELNFVDADKSSERQTGKDTNWREVVDRVLPFNLHRFEIKRSKVTFQNFDAEPDVSLIVQDIELVATNLTNVKDEDGRRVATARLEAKVLDDTPIKAEAEFDPFDFNDFLFAGEIRDLNLTSINTLTMHYAKLDFASGHGSVFTEVVAKDGKLTGYIKPLFEDVDIANWRQDVEQQGDNPFQLMWEAVVGFFKTLFTNRASEMLATQIDIEGTLDETKVDSWKAVWGVVRNAFGDAFEARFNELTPFTKGDESEE